MDVDLSNLTMQEARGKINKRLAEIRQRPVLSLRFNDNVWPIAAEDINWREDTEELLRKAYTTGREGEFWTRLKERFLVYNEGKQLDLSPDYDKRSLKNLIAQIALTLNRQPHDAAIFLESEELRFLPAVNGLKVDEEISFQLADKALSTNFPAAELAVAITQPALTSGDLAGLTDVLGKFTTIFNVLDIDRVHNIAIASDYLDGLLLKPGEIHSFNERIGPRTVEMGYRDAPVYEGEDIVPGIGGGICQVSSTLYNAVLLADLQLVERENHYRPVAYVPLGLDATIAGDLIDFKFKNNFSDNIYIRSIIDGDTLTVAVLGKKPRDFPMIRVVADNIQVINYRTIVRRTNAMPVGTEKIEREGANGYRVTTYRMKYKHDNTLLMEEKLYNDYYPVIDRIVEVGTMEEISASV
jgi:vancomycin resistance protein YoaR